MEEETDSYSVLSIMIENEDGEYEISKESSWPGDGYVFNDVLSKCENGSQISYNKDTKKVQLKSNKSDRCYVYFDMMALFKTCSNVTNLSTCLKNYYNAYGSEINMYLHDATLTNGAGDGSYRYAGANSDNYVCFGSDTDVCPDDDLYRIIGVFGDQVKLIKADLATKELLGEDGDYNGNITIESGGYKGSQTSIAQYNWNASEYSNDWSKSLLNKTNLNTNFINNIDDNLANKIEEVNWNVGGGLGTYEAIAKTFYDAEKTLTYNAKIGLISASEYGYATLPDYWTINLKVYNETNVKNNNWMYIGYTYWAITYDTRPSYPYGVSCVSSAGYLYSLNVGYNKAAVRPSFTLKSSVTYVSGSGTKTNPIRIN